MSNILVSGYGSMGKRHGETIKSMGHDLLVYDPKSHGSASFSKMLDRSSHVVISSAAEFHAEQAIEAIEAGTEVFIEKPMAMNAVEGRAIVAAAEKSEITVAVGYQWRSYSHLYSFKEMVNRMTEGHITLLYEGDKKDWPGDCYTDLLLECSHEIDAVRWLVGIPISVEFARVERNSAKIMYISKNKKLTVDVFLDWSCKKPKREWFASYKSLNLKWSFDENNKRDKAYLSLAYQDEIIYWLSSRPKCTHIEGLDVLNDIEKIKPEMEWK